MANDMRLGWFEKFAPLGSPIQQDSEPTPADYKRQSEREFEWFCFDSANERAAPIKQSEPAACAPFKVGDAVRTNSKAGTAWTTDTFTVTCVGGVPDHDAGWTCITVESAGGITTSFFAFCLERIETPAPHDHWVDWHEDAPRPVPFGTRVEIRRPTGRIWCGQATADRWSTNAIAAYRVVA
jgi:hypothetical protein